MGNFAYCVVFWGILIGTAQISVAQVLDSLWSQPYRLSGDGEVGLEGQIVSDRDGRTHVVWAETFGASQPRSSSLYYAQFDGDVWSGKVEIRRTQPPVTIGFLSPTIDEQKMFHLVWTEADTQFIGFPSFGPVFHSSVIIDESLDKNRWTAPVEIPAPARRLVLKADSGGVLHLLFSRWLHPLRGIYHMSSDNGGATWSEPSRIDPDIPQEHEPDVIDLEIDGVDGLHACWLYVDGPGGWGRWVRYGRSLDSGDNWSITTIDTAEAGSQELRLPFPALAVSGGTVHVVWAGGGTIDVGRRHRFSVDRGETWSPVSQIFGDLHGQANGDGLVTDHQGRLNFFGQIRWPAGLYRSIWEDGRWSPPQLFYLISKDWQDPLGNRVHAHGIRVASSDGQFVSTLTTAPGIDPSVNLYAMNTRRPILYFPHYGVGSGLSTVFSFSNPSDSYTTGTLKTFDPQGNPQELLFESGPASYLNVELPAKSTRVFVARSLDGPLLSGYAKFETDGTDVIGLSIFKYGSGLEASIAPVRPNRRFAIFAEETDTVSTGIALMRLSPKPILMKLYDSDGALVGTEELEMTGPQRSVFLKEIFTLPADFQGLLILESEGDYCPIALRFGRSVLSTVEAADLDSPGDSTSLLQYDEQLALVGALYK